ncbi:MAG: CRISPR-associated endonuclease Cas3'' [Candidatus Electrothrix aestuarii]|uniref:CRISPR-associated endonuclease Cas3 n=1 Tax=Candidatus Electrothrix aestuarii TaxID=3062594 RepID=A0AAU8LWC6_9BACT|nr:CRISPR-associated endonuclease Cas3'' [Candidatus Electrothrix aestuarii]
MKHIHIAHRRTTDQTEQTVAGHLLEVAAISGRLAGKINASEAGRLLGLLHDVGKYSKAFQDYIKSATGMLNPDRDDRDNEYIDSQALKGKIDHSTAGAQWIWQRFNDYGPQGKLVGQMLAVCLASHHGGLLDCLKVNGKNGFQKRITKEDVKTNLQECLQVADNEVMKQLEGLSGKEFLENFWADLVRIVAPEKKDSPVIQQFRLGLFTRFLFSCLIDADRINSADFEDPSKAKARSNEPVDWHVAIERMEAKNASFQIRNDIDTVRRKISDQCRQRAEDEQGIYTLTVPTGGGKTFSSMRYALHHAKKHNVDHIIYIIPFTSIIEQNAEEIRKVLEQEGDEFPWVLEHHSGLEPEELDWRTKLITENWDAPIIFTTMVQFLEVLFGGGTRGARRMHTLANSVLIFDEIQSLPVNCVHLFCNSLQFLVDHAGSTAVLCTATQPLLNDLRNPDKGQLDIPAGHELVDNMTEVFEQLKRVEINNLVRTPGCSEEEIAELALEELEEKGSCLIVVNTQ